MLQLNDPLVEKMLNAVAGEPECDVLYAAERIHGFAKTFFSDLSSQPVNVCLSSQKTQPVPAVSTE